MDGASCPEGSSAPSPRGRPLPAQRRERILELVERHNAVRVSDVAALLGVTDETVRRDIAHLEQEGFLVRQHGGAISNRMATESPYSKRSVINREAKRRIAQVAAATVSDGSTIIVDSGTTTGELVKLLAAKDQLTVITNGVSHVNDLLANPATTVVIIGGMIRRSTLGTAGDAAAQMLDNLHADQTFLAAQGFSAVAGVTYPSLEELAVKRAMVRAGAHVTLLADGSKCGRMSLVSVVPITDVDRIITTSDASEHGLDAIRELGVDISVIDISVIDPGPMYEQRGVPA